MFNVRCHISAFPEAEKFDRFLSVSEGISRLISNRDLGFSHDSTPASVSTFSSGVSASHSFIETLGNTPDPVGPSYGSYLWLSHSNRVTSTNRVSPTVSPAEW